jgi:hypothetical protein
MLSNRFVVAGAMVIQNAFLSMKLGNLDGR